MNDRRPDPDLPGRIVGAVFGCSFAGAGLAILIFLWASPFGEFHSPPLFVRVFGSFVAIPFVAIGGGLAYASITGKNPRNLTSGSVVGQLRELQRELNSQSDTNESTSSPSVGYDCPNCGARLGENADVSPHGDVKCTYCDRWFNIHR